MAARHKCRFTRREFVKLASVACGPFFVFPARSWASQKTLTIAKWAHFLPEFDVWFAAAAADWGKQHDLRVLVDNLPVEQVSGQAVAEVKNRKGHDIFIFPWPPAEYQRSAIDHGEIYQTVAFKYGTVHRLGHRSTYSPATKKYFAFCDWWMPAPFHYFLDYWRDVGMGLGPVHYNSLRNGSKALREKLNIPCGLALSSTLEGNITAFTILYAFGGGIHTGDGTLLIDTARTVEALNYIKLLYKDGGSPAQLNWGPGENVRAMLAGKTSCTINAISLLRMAEKQDRNLGGRIMIQQPLLGFSGVFGLPHVTNCSLIWEFAQNGDAAKAFVADMVDRSKEGYEQSRGCNFPIYQKTLPDLALRLQEDAHAVPAWKYNALKDALHWTANIGYPGFSDAATMEIFNRFTIQRMFSSVAKGELTPDEAADAATAEVKHVVENWNKSAAAPRGS